MYLGGLTESGVALCLVLNQVTGIELTAAEPDVGCHMRQLQHPHSVKFLSTLFIHWAAVRMKE